MFDHHCTACDRRHLVFPSQVTGIVNDDRGILVSYTCWCGSGQTWRSGNASKRSRPTLVAA